MLGLLFDKHGSDKARRHGYERVYGELPEPRSILEIGVLHGGSLRAWRDHWPKAKITGIDTFERSPMPMVHGARIVRGDSRTHDWGAEQFDLVIDDGDHSFQAQAETLLHMWPHVAEGGRYFIEDVWPWDRMGKLDREHEWLSRHPESWNTSGWERLLDALRRTGGRVVRHDLRDRAPDSYIIEVRKCTDS